MEVLLSTTVALWSVSLDSLPFLKPALRGRRRVHEHGVRHDGSFAIPFMIDKSADDQVAGVENGVTGLS